MTTLPSKLREYRPSGLPPRHSRWDTKYNQRMPPKELDEWMLDVGAAMHRLSSEMSPGHPKMARQKEWVPRVDVMETAKELVINVELAGINPNKLVVQCHSERGSVSVQGERQDESINRDVHISPHQFEIDYGKFAREIQLPKIPIDIESAKAHYDNGMLTISIPKVSASPKKVVFVERTIVVRKLL